MASSCIWRRFYSVCPWFLAGRTTRFRILRCHRWDLLQKSRIARWKVLKGWLFRCTWLGTGLSLCATPVVIPAEEAGEKKLLNVDPASLTHSSLIRNAASVAVDAASALVSQSVIAAIELHQQHAKFVFEMVSLYEQHIVQLGAPAEEDIWQEIIGWRVKAEDAKRAAEEVEAVLEAGIRTLEHAGEAAYQAGSETASLIAGQRVTLAQSQLEVARAVSSNALQELAKIQELSITVTAKSAEQESEEGQQQEAELAAA